MIDEQLARKIVSVLERLQDDGDGDLTLRREYSGRGMFGRKCVAVDVREGSAARVVCMIISELTSSDFVDECPEGDEFWLADRVAELCEALQYVKQDSMGLGTVIYWPNIQESETDNEPDE